MRESIGTSWVMGISIVFILIFSAYLAVILNYSKTFKAKNTVLNIIEKYEGFNSGSSGGMAVVNNYLVSSGYQETGKCEVGYYGATTLTGNNSDNEYKYIAEATDEKFHYCIKKVSFVNGKTKRENSYYRVILFTKTDLPVLGNVLTFTAQGRTINLENTVDSLFIVQ